MTEGKGASQEAPASPIVKHFSIFWINDDIPVFHYEGIVGSGRDDGWLYMVDQEGVESQVNLSQVQRMSIWTSP